jgi:Uma2 family endonuclease
MDYLSAGTPAVWVVDPQSETVDVYRALLAPTRLRAGDRLESADVLPGFSVPVEELFTIAIP